MRPRYYALVLYTFIETLDKYAVNSKQHVQTIQSMILKFDCNLELS